MKRYLTECATPGAPLQLSTGYTASAVLTGPATSLQFAALSSTLRLAMAPVFMGPTGDAASISADTPNLIKLGSDGKMTAQMEWSGTPNW